MIKRHALSVRQLKAVHSDTFTFWLIAGLCFIGLLMIFDASHIDALVQFGDKLHYAKLQLIWLIFGLTAMAMVTLTPLTWLKKISPFLLIFNLLLLILVLIPGVGSQFLGARRWLTIGNVVLQPAELAKLSLVLYLPLLLSKRNYLPSFIGIMALFLLLVVVEPDLGTALILSGISLGLLYLSGFPLKKIIVLVLGLTAVASIFIFASPYRLSRVKTFVNPANDPHGTSYHVRQILIALGSGGFSGTGIGRSRQKFQYLPEATTDSIFAVLAEETGFIGAASFVILLGFVCFRMFSQSQQIVDNYPRLIAYGVCLWFGLQMLINLSAMVSIIPLTGVPLPFISYGGSALFTALLALGLYLNASRFRAPA